MTKKKNNNKRNKKNKGGKKGNKNLMNRKKKTKQNRKNKDKFKAAINRKIRKKDKIVSEIFEDKHYDFDFIKDSINKDLEEKSSRSRKRNERPKKRQREESKAEKILTKMWRDWLPVPGLEIQNILRLRMDDCNWSDFTDHGHSQDLQLIPRSAFKFGDMVQIIDSVLNPFNISAADEDSEFEDELAARKSINEEEKLENHFANLDIAMYNVIEDPEETTDLRDQFPEIFEELKENVLVHIKNIVPEDFPDPDYYAHPRNFDNNFSPGWCSPK